jgi:predicted lipoprotein with Yx(FWY)xxD motif
MNRFLTVGLTLTAALLASTIMVSAATMLTAKNGMTLYVFDKDTGGVSTCYDACAQKWPPYAAKSGEKMGEGWSSTKRKDGSLQWAYDKKPVYFYAGDKKKGDKTGDGIGGAWHIVSE